MTFTVLGVVPGKQSPQGGTRPSDCDDDADELREELLLEPAEPDKLEEAAESEEATEEPEEELPLDDEELLLDDELLLAEEELLDEALFPEVDDPPLSPETSLRDRPLGELPEEREEKLSLPAEAD